MAQQDLFPETIQQPVVIIARSTDPETSHEAAAAFDQQKATRSVQTVVKILTERGPLTDFQIRELWESYWAGPFSYTLPCKARHWARQAGKVKLVGYGRHHKRKVRVWGLGPDNEYMGAPTKKGLIEENARLREENARLRAILKRVGL